MKKLLLFTIISLFSLPALADSIPVPAQVQIVVDSDDFPTIPGESAYDAWKSLPGNSAGTMQDFIDDITGPQGPAGQDGSGSTPAVASQAEAEAGTDNTKMMTALRTKQAITAAGAPGVTIGHYTPTLTNGSNAPTLSAYQNTWKETCVSSVCIVDVFGKLDVDPTSVSTNTAIGISLPSGKGSNFTAPVQCVGTGASLDGGQSAWGIAADSTNDRCNMQSYSSRSDSHAIYYHFSYERF